jgi:hypothetical protein
MRSTNPTPARRHHVSTLAMHASLFWFLLTLSLCQLPHRWLSPHDTDPTASLPSSSSLSPS